MTDFGGTVRYPQNRSCGGLPDPMAIDFKQKYGLCIGKGALISAKCSDSTLKELVQALHVSISLRLCTEGKAAHARYACALN